MTSAIESFDGIATDARAAIWRSRPDAMRLMQVLSAVRAARAIRGQTSGSGVGFRFLHRLEHGQPAVKPLAQDDEAASRGS
jgi:hypothetical protein